MYQYQMFVNKEWKQISQNKKLIFMFIGFIFFYPIMNNFIVTYDHGVLLAPILPLDFCHMFYLALSAASPSDMICPNMNEEFITQSYDILSISKINKSKIIFSKLTLPVLFGMGLLLVSYLLNEYLVMFTDRESLSLIMNPSFISFVFLIIIFFSLCSLHHLIRAQKYVDAKSHTSQVAISVSFVFGWIVLYYLNLKGVAFVSLGLTIFTLFYRIHYLLSHYKPSTQTEEEQVYFDKPISAFLILCHEAYCHFWNAKKTVIYLLIVMIASMSLNRYQQDLNLPILNELFPLSLYLFLGNSILSQNILLQKQAHGFMMMRIAKVYPWKIVLSRLAMPVFLGGIGTLVIQLISKENLLTLSHTLNFLALNVLMSLSILVSYLAIKKIKYVTQYRSLITLVLFVISCAASILHVPTYIIFIADSILFLISLYCLKNAV